jgi:hypothetical protein
MKPESRFSPANSVASTDDIAFHRWQARLELSWDAMLGKHYMLLIRAVR